MWESIVGWIRFLWEAGKQTEENTTQIRQLRDNDGRLFQVVQALAVENELLRKEHEQMRENPNHLRELHERDVRELELKLRLQVSEELRRLPPPDA